MISLLFNMNLHASETSRVPVGVVCESASPAAERLNKRLLESDALRVTSGTMEELTQLLMDGYIGSIFVIGDDYEEKLRSGIREDIIKVITPSDDTSSIIVQDIVAGYMMYDVCFFRTFEEYSSLPDMSVTEEEFSEYVASVAENPMYDFDFDIRYIDVGSRDKNNAEITTAMIYRQIIAGLIGMLLLVLVVCGCNGFATENVQSIALRRRTIAGNLFNAYLLEMAAVLVYLTPAILLSALIMIGESGPGGAVLVFLMGEALCMFFIIVCFVLAAVIKSASAYQLVGTVICLLLGACGFINTFSSISGTPLFGWTPVAAYINAFVEVLV